jgi:hypothetical protein
MKRGVKPCTRCGERPAMPIKTICAVCNREALQAGMDRMKQGKPAARSLSRAQFEASNRSIARQIAWMEREGLMPDSRRGDEEARRSPTLTSLRALLRDTASRLGDGYKHRRGPVLG